MYYFNLFFVYSILGYFIEEGGMALLGMEYNSSLLTGPWTVVYGIASLAIIYAGNRIDLLNYKKGIKVLIFIIISCLMLTSIEFIAGWSIEATLGIVYWDYSGLPYHFTKYVSLPISIIWTVYALLLYYLIYPYLNPLIKKIPKYITIILMVLFVVDILYSAINYLQF